MPISKSCRSNLSPVNQDIPAHWECRCRGIAIIQRDAVFEINRQVIQDLYKLHKCTYDIENRNWDIESGEWISPDEFRIKAKRKVIHADQRQDIIDELQRIIQEELNIGFENFQDYFLG